MPYSPGQAICADVLVELQLFIGGVSVICWAVIYFQGFQRACGRFNEEALWVIEIPGWPCSVHFRSFKKRHQGKTAFLFVVVRDIKHDITSLRVLQILETMFKSILTTKRQVTTRTALLAGECDFCLLL